MSAPAAGRGRVRPIEVLRGVWGTALLLAPRQVLGTVHGVEADGVSVGVARVLGARQLAQAVLSGLDPSPEVLALGVWVDTVHAASAVGLAVVDPPRARAGWTDAGVALTWGLLGLRDLRRGRTDRSGDDHRRDLLARWALGLLPGTEPLHRLASRG